jgi:hypothetical protein
MPGFSTPGFNALQNLLARSMSSHVLPLRTFQTMAFPFLELKITAFWDTAPFNVPQRGYTTLQPGRLTSLHSPPSEPEYHFLELFRDI